MEDNIISFGYYDINALIRKSHSFIFNNYSKVFLSEEGSVSWCLSLTKYKGGSKIAYIFEVINN